MSLTINIYYSGENGNAGKFVDEMISSGIVNRIRNEEALDIHHKSEMMKEIASLREKYHLKMRVEKYKEWEN